MAATFYVRIADKIHGPFEAEKLKKLAAVGKIGRDDEVSRDKQSWTRAFDVKGLGFAVESITNPHRGNGSAAPSDADNIAAKLGLTPPAISSADEELELTSGIAPTPSAVTNPAISYAQSSSAIAAVAPSIPPQQTSSPLYLRPCIDCGQPISIHASQCPHCGMPIKVVTIDVELPWNEATLTPSALGIALSMLGVLGILFFSLVFETAVRGDGEFLERVFNLSLGQAQLIGIIVSTGLFVFGRFPVHVRTIRSRKK